MNKHYKLARKERDEELQNNQNVNPTLFVSPLSYINRKGFFNVNSIPFSLSYNVQHNRNARGNNNEKMKRFVSIIPRKGIY